MKKFFTASQIARAPTAIQEKWLVEKARLKPYPCSQRLCCACSLVRRTGVSPVSIFSDFAHQLVMGHGSDHSF
jgi:hypothetical protein